VAARRRFRGVRGLGAPRPRGDGGGRLSAPLVISGLRREYGRLVALEGLDLTIEAGEVVALIGPNGCGKTTAVRTVAGLLEPTAGEVRVAGASVHREPEAATARAALSLVPDGPLLYDDLDVRQHLELVAAAHGVDAPTDRIDALIGRLGLRERTEFLPRELSRGLRQRAMLACALVRPFSVLVLDEPVVGLDPPTQGILRDLLAEAAADGAAVLFTTHQLGFADGLAVRAVRLDEGRVADEGAFADVIARAEELGWGTAWS
jgi:ABC-2 type transport system ATP-binding protein